MLTRHVSCHSPSERRIAARQQHSGQFPGFGYSHCRVMISLCCPHCANLRLHRLSSLFLPSSSSRAERHTVTDGCAASPAYAHLALSCRCEHCATRFVVVVLTLFNSRTGSTARERFGMPKQSLPNGICYCISICSTAQTSIQAKIDEMSDLTDVHEQVGARKPFPGVSNTTCQIRHRAIR